MASVGQERYHLQPLGLPGPMIKRLFRVSEPDPLGSRADGLAESIDRQLTASLPRIVERVPALQGVDPGAWRRVAVVAATAIAIFPLLQTVGRDPPRFDRLKRRARAGLRARFPGTDRWDEAQELGRILTAAATNYWHAA